MQASDELCDLRHCVGREGIGRQGVAFNMLEKRRYKRRVGGECARTITGYGIGSALGGDGIGQVIEPCELGMKGCEGILLCQQKAQNIGLCVRQHLENGVVCVTEPHQTGVGQVESIKRLFSVTVPECLVLGVG